MFKPSKNFHRGFNEWIWIRGQETDSYRSGPTVPDREIERHMIGRLQAIRRSGPSCASTRETSSRGGTRQITCRRRFSARLRAGSRPIETPTGSFSSSTPLIRTNRGTRPRAYRRPYDRDEDTPDLIQFLYGPYEGRLTDRELRRLQANYAGEVTMVDRWFGFFMETLQRSGRLEDTVVAVVSDHGHNLGYPQDKGLVSKQGHPMTRSVADLVMMIRHPDGVAAGSTCDALVYNHDLVETLLSLTGNAEPTGRDGKDFWPVVLGHEPAIRDHVTVAWGPLVTVLTDDWWYNASIWGEGQLLYRVSKDPDLIHDLSSDEPDVCGSLLDAAVGDAGGSIPEFFHDFHNRPGCTPFEDRSDVFGKNVGILVKTKSLLPG